MVDLPYEVEFSELPQVDVSELVDYFNAEFAGDGGVSFSDSDFDYLGVYEVDGYEKMYWSVKGSKIYAVVRPFAGSYITEMDSLPEGAVLKDK